MDSECEGVSEEKNSKRASQEIFLKFLVKNYKKLQSTSNVTTIMVMCMQTNRDMYFYFNSLPMFFDEGGAFCFYLCNNRFIIKNCINK